MFAISHAPSPRKSLKGSARAGLGELLGPFTLSSLAVASLALWHSSLGYLPKHWVFPSSFGIQLLRGEGGTCCHPLHPPGLPVGLQDSQVSSGILIHFYGFKQRLEVPSTKALQRWQQLHTRGLVALGAHGQDQQEIPKPTWWLCLWITSRNTVGLS